MKFSLTLLLILSFASLNSAYQIEQQKEGRTEPGTPFISQSSNLGFGNYNGLATPDQIQSFINFINSASTYYRDSPQSRLSYISDKMNAAYGNADFGYSVILADNKSYSWYIWATSNYASVAPGIDRIFPTASYMFIRSYMFNDRDYFYNIGQKGSGIDSNLENVIKNTIIAYETSSTCYCYNSDTTNISKALVNYDNKQWDVLCSASNDMYAFTYSFARKYIYLKPKNCYYAIFAV